MCHKVRLKYRVRLNSYFMTWECDKTTDIECLNRALKHCANLLAYYRISIATTYLVESTRKYEA